METIKTDLCIIGGGSGGLSVAAGASQMGADCVLIEHGAMGGDCLNYGCVPSKSLLKAAKIADTIRHAGMFGINGHEPAIDFAAVYRHVQGVIAAIAPHDSQERFEGLGVRVLRSRARFADARTIVTDDQRIEARRIVLAAGSRPAIPPIAGLDQINYLTNETLFQRTEPPGHLIVLGGGPIGSEMAQAHRRLGARVSLIDLGPILPRDDLELVEIIRKNLIADGVALFERAKVKAVRAQGNGIAVDIEHDGAAHTVEGSDLLVATGRTANVDDLELDKGEVEYSDKGIHVDAGLRSISNRHVFAVGDIAGGPQFTHVAGDHAGIVIKRALFRLPAKASYSALPHVTFTDPELAQVGMSEQAARDAGIAPQVLRWSFKDNDRAQAERRTEGLIKVVCRGNGRILGAGIAGLGAGELIHSWTLAMHTKQKIGAMATMIAPYPTLGEVSKRAAGSWYTPKLFSPRTRAIVRFLARFG